MEWIKSKIVFKYLNDSQRTEVSFNLVHFDAVESPIVPGSIFNGDCSELEQCSSQSMLGSVLWLEAIELFLPFLCEDIQSQGLVFNKVLCLGEGTGAVGCGLAAANRICSEIIISDLPNLLPLLKINASLSTSNTVRAISVDWTCPLHPDLRSACDAVIACEVLYGNRSVWEALLDTINTSLGKKNHHEKKSAVYICVTLRNARNDVDDFKKLYLSRISEVIDEIPLSPSVSVIRALI